MENVVDLDGWKSRDVLAHVAGVGSMVGARTGKSATELADELETAHRGIIEFIKNAPDELLAQRVTVRGYKDVPISDIAMRMVVLHGLAHIYSVYSAVMNEG